MPDRNDTTRRRSPVRKAVRAALRLLHRTPVVSAGLVLSAVLIGVLYYAQAGLLVRQDGPSFDQTQAPDLSAARDVAQQPKQSVLEQQESVVPDIDAPATQPTTPASPVCDEQAKENARVAYERLIETENDLHEKKLSDLSKLSKILYMISGEKLSREARYENLRHDKAMELIAQDYQKSLAKINCQG